MDNYIIDIVDRYNTQVAEQLAFVEDFTPSEKGNGHGIVLTYFENAYK